MIDELSFTIGAWLGIPAAYLLGLPLSVAFGYAIGVSYATAWLHFAARKGGEQ